MLALLLYSNSEARHVSVFRLYLDSGVIRLPCSLAHMLAIVAGRYWSMILYVARALTFGLFRSDPNLRMRDL